VVAESPLTYETFRLALQLADRSGAVSEARLADFRDLLRDIADQIPADLNLPDVAEAAACAQRLDAFCAEVDQMIGLNILPAGENLLQGRELAQVAAHHGMTLQADGAFHLLDAQGRTLFSLSNFDNTPFQHHTLDQTLVIGLSLQLDVPRVEQPTRRFDEMAQLARAIGNDLRAAVVDDNRMTLSDAAIAMIRAQVAAIEDRMLAYPIIPGSAQARRLFS
jgi:FtsZ-interacting cell division protein ZipA